MPAAPPAAPAVGEKNRFEVERALGEPPGCWANGLVDFVVPMGAAERWSRDMVELAPTTLYMPRFLPGAALMAFMSERFWAMAARLTERCSDHATMPRHASTAAPKKARMAPTQMNTVPSGRSDFCINGALAVSGIFCSGIPTPARVGRPKRPPALEEVTVGKALLSDWVAVVLACVVSASADDCAEVVCGALDAGAELAAVSPGPSGWEMVARSGRPLSCATTEVAATSSRPARPTEARILMCVRGREPIMECCGAVPAKRVWLQVQQV